jgi:transposase
MSATVSSRPGRRPDPTLRALWDQRLRRFDHSDQSAADFCSEQGLSLPSFYAWRRRLRGSGPPDAPAANADGPRFLPITLLPAAAAIELVLPTGTVLRVTPGCDLAFLRSLVASLGGVSC